MDERKSDTQQLLDAVDSAAHGAEGLRVVTLRVQLQVEHQQIAVSQQRVRRRIRRPVEDVAHLEERPAQVVLTLKDSPTRVDEVLASRDEGRAGHADHGAASCRLRSQGLLPIASHFLPNPGTSDHDKSLNYCVCFEYCE
jgi:hypothetical protein